MNKDIQPQIYKNAVVTCACGNTFETISTKKTLSVEICSACHPFYTGQQKFVDTEGRIDKFAKKQKLAEQKMKAAEETKAKKDSKKTAAKSPKETPTLKEMLSGAKEDKE